MRRAYVRVRKALVIFALLSSHSLHPQRYSSTFRHIRPRPFVPLAFGLIHSYSRNNSDVPQLSTKPTTYVGGISQPETQSSNKFNKNEWGKRRSGLFVLHKGSVRKAPVNFSLLPLQPLRPRSHSSPSTYMHPHSPRPSSRIAHRRRLSTPVGFVAFARYNLKIK